jgi:hypothetical protein
MRINFIRIKNSSLQPRLQRFSPTRLNLVSRTSAVFTNTGKRAENPQKIVKIMSFSGSSASISKSTPGYVEGYFNIDDILASQERVPCKFQLPVYGLGRFSKSQRGTRDRQGVSKKNTSHFTDSQSHLITSIPVSHEFTS